MAELSHAHRFLPAADASSARTLLLLHGTGGDEDDLLLLGCELDPAANLLLLRPEVLTSAILLRAMLPLRPATLPDLAGKSVLLLGGETDRMIPREGTEALARLLTEAGADVRLVWQPAGHNLLDEDVRVAREFLIR